jgi:16S rRNA (guanine966-N2)-methyltransferase
MNLRIISGALRGRRISLPEKQVTFRPTKDRVRQSIAETIKEQIPGAAAADFCAGSGAFGIECASRGAATVHFVERDRMLARSLSASIDSLGILSQCSVFNIDIVSFVRQCSFLYDIIFFDPPYENEELAALVAEIIPLLSRGGILLYEYSPRLKKSRPPFEFPDAKNVIVETKAYGDTAVDIFRFGT